MQMEHPGCKPCWTCRNRHVQCDLSPTPCTKCQKAGLECFEKLPLRWVKGVALRGKMQGHTYENKSENRDFTMKKPKHIRFKSPVVKIGTSRHNGASEDSFVLPITLPSPSLSGLDEASRYYLDYYNKRICSNFVVYDSSKNPLRNLIPIALEDSILRNAVLALAARHLVNQGKSFHRVQVPVSSEAAKFNHDALFFKHRVIEGLSNTLCDSHCSENNVASIFLLILLDLLESGGDEWQVHLKGAKGLITGSLHQSPLETATEVSQKEPTQMIQGIRDFVIQQIIMVETLGSLFLRPKSPSRDMIFDQRRMAQESMDYSFLACPQLLLDAIRRISSARDSIARSEIMYDTVIQAHSQAITVVLEQVEHFDCASWASGLQQPSSSRQNTHFLAIVAQVYKIGALLYGRRVISILGKVNTPQDDLLLELLGLLNGLRNNQPLLKCVLWPIFVAGLECRSLAQRNFFIARLEDFWMTTNCLNVINAAKILHEYWQQDDRENLCWPFDVGHFGQSWLLI